MKRDIDYKLVVAATFVSLVAAVSMLNYNAFHNTQKELISIAYRSVKATGVTLRLIANHPDVTPEQLQDLLDQLTGQGFDYVAGHQWRHPLLEFQI